MVKDYDLDIVYHKGKARVIADALSRKREHSNALVLTDSLCHELSRLQIELVLPETSQIQLNVMVSAPSLYEKIRAKQSDDPIYRKSSRGSGRERQLRVMVLMLLLMAASSSEVDGVSHLRMRI